VRGQGKVIPSSQLQVVQNLEGGIVKDLQVREGDVVEAGQVLLRIDDTRFDSSLQENRMRLLALQAKSLRLRAEAEGATELPVFPAEIREALPQLAEQETKLFEQRARQLTAALRVLQEQSLQKRQSISELESRQQQVARSLELAQRELDVTRPLGEQGVVSEVEILRLEREVNELQGQLDQATLAIPRLQAELAEVAERADEARIKFEKDARAEYNDTMAELSSLAAGNVALKDRVQRTAVRAPIRGIVKKLLVNTVGGVVTPGMDLVEIVPLEDSLLVEAKLKPSDIAFVRPGLDATVKLSAYDFSIYGGLGAKVEHISADTFVEENGEAYYLVRVRTEEPSVQREGKSLAIMPGMTAEVDVLVGEKTVLAYLLKPVLRAKANALREP
jgi:adhesin transport system membrane fusion protein